MAEAKIQVGILNLLKWFKAWTVKIVTANKGGVPDTISCVPITPEIAKRLFLKYPTIGLFVAIEVKDTGKQATPLQKAQIKRIRQAGGVAFEADSEEKAERILKEFLE